jgi:hypothetical protein
VSVRCADWKAESRPSIVAVGSHATRTLSPLGLELEVLAFLPYRWILVAALPWPKWSQITLPVCCPVLSSPLLTSPPSIIKTFHTHSLTRSTPLDVDRRLKRNYHLYHATTRQLLCANAGLQHKYTFETPREIPARTATCGLQIAQLWIQPRRFDQACEWTHNRTIPRISLSSGPYVL